MDFNHDAELPRKKKDELKRSSISGEMFCKRIKQSDWLRTFLGHMVFPYVGLGSTPSSVKK